MAQRCLSRAGLIEGLDFTCLAAFIAKVQNDAVATIFLAWRARS